VDDIRIDHPVHMRCKICENSCPLPTAWHAVDVIELALR